MIFAEALTTLGEYRAFTKAMGKVPVLANLTEFGKTPLFTLDELRSAGVAIALYPLGAFRAMSRAAEGVYGGLSPAEQELARRLFNMRHSPEACDQSCLRKASNSSSG